MNTTNTNLEGVAGWMASLIDSLGAAGVDIVILLETVFPPIPSAALPLGAAES